MYTFADRSDRSLTLRPEGTAPICRAYVEHGLHREPQPQKLYTIAPMYRYGAPGRGRYREHWQLSVEAIGSDDPAIDAEIIQLYDTLLRRLGVASYRLELNSIGCRECRPAYVERLTAWLDEHRDELDEEARQKLRDEPAARLRRQERADAALLDDAPKIGDSLCDACREHFAAVRADLDATGVAYELVPTLVRGLDYYSRTTWEFIGPMDNENSTISGGGRYDYLVEEIGGPPTPGRRLRRRDRAAADRDRGRGRRRRRAADASTSSSPSSRTPTATLVPPLLKELRDGGVAADTDYAGRSLKGQLTQAGRSGAATTVIVRADDALIRAPGRAGRTGRPRRRSSADCRDDAGAPTWPASPRRSSSARS